jgi:hypothetical protein
VVKVGAVVSPGWPFPPHVPVSHPRIPPPTTTMMIPVISPTVQTPTTTTVTRTTPTLTNPQRDPEIGSTTINEDASAEFFDGELVVFGRGSRHHERRLGDNKARAAEQPKSMRPAARTSRRFGWTRCLPIYLPSRRAVDNRSGSGNRGVPSWHQDQANAARRLSAGEKGPLVVAPAVDSFVWQAPRETKSRVRRRPARPIAFASAHQWP